MYSYIHIKAIVFCLIKMTSRIPMPVKHRQVAPHEMKKLVKEKEDVRDSLARVRCRLQHLKTGIVSRRPPLIARKQDLTAIIGTNSRASSVAVLDA